MTRFARAKGSKASNERVPEVATPWHVMKEQLDQRKQEAVESKKRKQAEATRMENYKAFLEEKDNDVKPEWVEFEERSSKPVESKTPKKRKKMLQKDGDSLESESQLQNIICEIEKVLDDEGKVTQNENKTNKERKHPASVTVSIHQHELKKIQNTSLIEENISSTKAVADVSDNEDAPEEMSAKIIPTPFKNKKKIKFPKKVSVHIPSMNTTKEEKNDNENLNEKQNIMNRDRNNKQHKKKDLNSVKEIANENVNSGAIEKQKKKHIQKNKNQIESTMNIKPKKSLEEMTDDEIKRFNKKKEKRMRQLENKKKRKAELKEKALREEENQNMAKRKLPKQRDNEEHKRRKPDSQIQKIYINGVDIDIDYCDGFPVKKEDAERIRKLKKEMISKGIPKSEVQISLKLERRKAEKALAREKKKVCFNCRKSGHVLSECPDLNESSHQETTGTGICFKCGSTEHTHFECKVVRSENFKYATCFICREQGHISRQCPDNERGLYPKGGACRVCGDVTHLKKDCPKFQAEQESQAIKLEALEFNNVEGLSDTNKPIKGHVNKSKKIVTF